VASTLTDLGGVEQPCAAFLGAERVLNRASRTSYDVARAIFARHYRGGLREWLKLLKEGLGGGRPLKGLEGGLGDAVRALLERCLSSDEPDLAGLACRCLGQWRMPHLTPENADRLSRLVGPGRYRPPRHPTHHEPSFIELSGIL